MAIFATRRVTGPNPEPVSVSELRDHLRIDDDSMDAQIQRWAKSARLDAESLLGKKIGPQTWQIVFTGWPSGRVLELPLPPVRSIASVTYLDQDWVTYTLEPEKYRLIEDISALYLLPAYSWPSVTLIPAGGVRVEIVTGIADSDGGSPETFTVPENLKQAIRWYVGQMHRNPEASTLGSILQSQELSLGYKHILAGEKYLG